MALRVMVIALLLVLTCSAQETPSQPAQTPEQAQPAAAPAKAEQPAAPAAAPAADGKATVYVYRYKQAVGAALEPSVYCDEVQLARMDNGRYFVVKLEPGRHTFRSNDKQAGIELEFKAGQEYYVRVELVTGFWKGHGRVVHATPEQGAYEIKKLQPLGPDKIIDKKLVVAVESKPTA